MTLSLVQSQPRTAQQQPRNPQPILVDTTARPKETWKIRLWKVIHSPWKMALLGAFVIASYKTFGNAASTSTSTLAPVRRNASTSTSTLESVTQNNDLSMTAAQIQATLANLQNIDILERFPNLEQRKRDCLRSKKHRYPEMAGLGGRDIDKLCPEGGSGFYFLWAKTDLVCAQTNRSHATGQLRPSVKLTCGKNVISGELPSIQFEVSYSQNRESIEEPSTCLVPKSFDKKPYVKGVAWESIFFSSFYDKYTLPQNECVTLKFNKTTEHSWHHYISLVCGNINPLTSKVIFLSDFHNDKLQQIVRNRFLAEYRRSDDIVLLEGAIFGTKYGNATDKITGWDCLETNKKAVQVAQRLFRKKTYGEKDIEDEQQYLIEERNEKMVHLIKRLLPTLSQNQRILVIAGAAHLDSELFKAFKSQYTAVFFKGFPIFHIAPNVEAFEWSNRLIEPVQIPYDFRIKTSSKYAFRGPAFLFDLPPKIHIGDKLKFSPYLFQEGNGPRDINTTLQFLFLPDSIKRDIVAHPDADYEVMEIIKHSDYQSTSCPMASNDASNNPFISMAKEICGGEDST